MFRLCYSPWCAAVLAQQMNCRDNTGIFSNKRYVTSTQSEKTTYWKSAKAIGGTTTTSPPMNPPLTCGHSSYTVLLSMMAIVLCAASRLCCYISKQQVSKKIDYSVRNDLVIARQLQGICWKTTEKMGLQTFPKCCHRWRRRDVLRGQSVPRSGSGDRKSSLYFV